MMVVSLGDGNVPSGIKDLAVFVHIPKTAGMTFRKILDRQFTADQICKIGPDFQGSIDGIRNLGQEEKRKTRCISGHIPYGIHQYFPNHSVHYLSFIRDPVDRAVSEYFYFRNRTELRPLIGLEQSCNFTPEVYIEHLDQVGMGDFQTRILSGFGDMIKRVLPPYPPIPEEVGSELLQVIYQNYAFIGTVSLFDESLLMLRQQFSWPNIRYIRRNVAKVDPERIELKQAISEQIRRLNPLDCRLHHDITVGLTKKIDEGGKRFVKELNTYRLKNRCYSWAWQAYRKSGLRSMRMALAQS